MSDTLISDWIKLGAFLRQARNERGWTQIQMAQRAGVSRAWLARLESGHRRAELESILRLFTALDLRLFARANDPGGVNGAPEAGHVLNLIAAEAAVADSRSAATERRQRSWQLAAQVARSPGGA
ncbi:MAG: helix-turn-helix transcriptional regulator [Actinobacteria bacterium]|nr:helix-turn-helix transcriptional regulator [Actinomycetota bacterium]